MIHSHHSTRLASLCLMLLTSAWGAPSSAQDSAAPPALSDPALEALLQKRLQPEEGVQLQSRLQAELEHRFTGQEEVVIWTTLGPSYWSTNLSVLSYQQNQWTLLATLSLGSSEATLASLTGDGVITVTAKTPGPNDPLCCPSVQKTQLFRYGGGQLVEVLQEPGRRQP